MSWRVQATWTVDGEPKSYAPQFARTRLGAERLKRQTERTLGHFPSLEVLVEKSDIEPSDEPVASRLPDAVHLVASPLAETTACGVPRVEVDAVATKEIFALSTSQCGECVAAS
ncbi:hypothetical protein OJ997_36120 [Solirubrobacter phytolaccae]|uniref:Uncharacterized protein n=1 Tax=Solirubrobacter phytolaccae TaxID=1404360 RepID=A0A9X3NRC5_9ACTN|nr:hypothetical protein [Solirubrobacter phytolaccae]MDA0185787.1 hypothetical protein [Solirubrobacter phytolaccae]